MTGEIEETKKASLRVMTDRTHQAAPCFLIIIRGRQKSVTRQTQFILWGI